jgi:SLOG in TRPM, prokaryote/SMODS and SLOG-associating 2TM effector domain 1/Protein of unknown function (DUF4231)
VSERAEEVAFENGRRAKLVAATADPNPDELLSRLSLDRGRPVIVVIGGADTLAGEAYDLSARVVGPGVARAAAATRAVVVDGGTAAGIMEIVGDAVRQQQVDGTAVVGVAPSGCVTYPGAAGTNGGRSQRDPNHSHFVLAASSEWGGETRLLVDLSTAVAAGKPIVMVVAGGGGVTLLEVLEASRRGWPIVVATGTGGTADDVAGAWRAAHERQPRRLAKAVPKRLHRVFPSAWIWREPSAQRNPDRVLDEVVRVGDVRLHELDNPNDLARRLAWELQDVKVLKRAWTRFATYDELAATSRRSFERIQRWILLLGILATLVALLKSAVDISPKSSVWWIDDVLHWTVVALPILVGVLAALGSRYGSGKRWVLLRGAAETIKREIYRFRTGTGIYEPRAGQMEPEELLGEQLDAIETKLLQTEASSAELTPYAGPLPPVMYGASRDDDGLTPLDPDRYLALRIGDQLNYFHPKVAALSRTRRRFQFAVVAAGAAGAILAAAGQEIWVGLTAAIAAAALAYLGYLQVESTLVAYNQVAGKLESLRTRWEARPSARRDRTAFTALVADAETVLATELGGWIQQMSEALEELQAKELESERRAGIEAGHGEKSG